MVSSLSGGSQTPSIQGQNAASSPQTPSELLEKMKSTRNEALRCLKELRSENANLDDLKGRLSNITNLINQDIETLQKLYEEAGAGSKTDLLLLIDTSKRVIGLIQKTLNPNENVKHEPWKEGSLPFIETIETKFNSFKEDRPNDKEIVVIMDRVISILDQGPPSVEQKRRLTADLVLLENKIPLQPDQFKFGVTTLHDLILKQIS
jgi:hypothetical protein